MADLEELLIGIATRHWGFSLRHDDGRYSMILLKSEWVTSNLGQSVPLPTFAGVSALGVAEMAWVYIMGKP
jgi:hypothetical protein